MRVEFELRCPISADLAFIRDLVRLHGHHGGLTGERLEDLVLAVNEAVTNVLDHGGAAGLVTATRDAIGVTVEILDTAGRLTPDHLTTARVDPTASHGFGLWVIQRLCDSVALECTGLGSRLRLRMLVPASSSPSSSRAPHSNGSNGSNGSYGSYGDCHGDALTGGAYPWA